MRYKDLSRQQLIEIANNYLACIDEVSHDINKTIQDEFGWVKGDQIPDWGVSLGVGTYHEWEPG